MLSIILAALLDIVPMGDAFLRQVTPRDSILVADQLEYGVLLKDVRPGEAFAFPKMEGLEEGDIVLVSDWKLDTLKAKGSKRGRRGKADGPLDIEASVVLAPFREGGFAMDPLPIARIVDTLIDTLVFNPVKFEVKTIEIDTATFQIHDIKDQARYPVTAAEVFPWVLVALAAAALAWLAVWLIRRRKSAQEGVQKDPAYIVALRKLEKFRSDKFWAPEKQKAFYSGITDALKEYMDERFGVDAPEMTTAEVFTALKSEKDITPELYDSLKSMFERADFVKFAKYVASEEENAATLPLAVRFVTDTYKLAETEETQGEEAAA